MKGANFRVKLQRLTTMLVMACVLCISALAEETTSSTTDSVSAITTQLTNGLTAIVPQILTGMGALAVAGLAIFAGKFAVQQGLALFRRVTGRG